MFGSKIKKIDAREILDSRGNPTVEVELETKDGKFISAVPSGASTGKFEAVELRDNDSKKYSGKGVLKAVENIKNIIAPMILGIDARKQGKIDRIMIEADGTENKSKLGANAILAVSMAVCRAGARSNDISLWQYISGLSGFKPAIARPCFNIINGGAHAGGDLDIQEFMVIPEEISFAQNFEAGSEIYHILKNVLKENYGEKAINIGDEGGFVPPISNTIEALSLIKQAISKHSNTKIGLDCAATQFLKGKTYFLEKKDYNSSELLDFYKNIINNFPIIYLEDPYSEEDWPAWKNINEEIKNAIIIGDDLTVTNKNRLDKAVEENCITGIIIKPNQVGTISETIETIITAKKNKIKIIVSHRSGETTDDFISDLAVGVGAEFIKSGAPARGERLAKYNRLLKIEEEIKS